MNPNLFYWDGSALALSYLHKNFHLYKDSRTPNLSPAQRNGLLGAGGDGFVLGVVHNGQAMALKVGAVGSLMLRETTIYRMLFMRTFVPTAGDASAVTMHVYGGFWATCTLNELIQALHGSTAPCSLTESLAASINCAPDIPRTLVGMSMAMAPTTVSRCWTAGGFSMKQMENLYIQTVATLAVLQPLGFTHNDLHSANLMVINANLPTGAVTRPVRLAGFKMPDGRYFSVRLPAGMFKNEFAQIVRPRVVLADVGRCALGMTGDDLNVHYDWPEELAPYLNGPHNFANPGYDIWILACDMVMHMPADAGASPLLAAMVPKRAKIDSLRERVGDTCEWLSVMDSMRTAIDTNQPFDGVRARIGHEDKTGLYYWRLPWQKDLYPTPEEVLTEIAEAAGCQWRINPPPDSVVVQLH